MNKLGSNWDITVIRRVEQVGQASMAAPSLTSTAPPPEAAEAAVPAMVEKDTLSNNKAAKMGIPDDPVAIYAYIVHNVSQISWWII